MRRNLVVSCVVLLAVAVAACSPAGGGGGGGGGAAPATNSGEKVIVVTNTPTPGPQVPENVPIMPGATDLNVTGSDVSYVIKSDMQGVMDFYQKELAAKGWTQQEKPSVLGDFGRLYYKTPDYQLSIMLNASPSLNQVVIRISRMHLTVFEGSPTPKP